ncbi:UNVERIFIED_CONTAM: hypothetical protein Slati_0125900 [Sesamum latifolium]|uniref:Uncharacterized protein n=1 Tax=Sesamum latifolium TaxID=2727402 RepID=A0AAW2Y9G2_9LAMI
MFNEFSKLKLLVVAETRFASVIVMLKRFKLIKQPLKMMVISKQWSCYRDDDITKARNVKEKLLDDSWWDSIDYILDFTEPIYEMLRATDTDKPCLHLVYDMWDNKISKVKETIYKHEKKADYEESSFWGVVHKEINVELARFFGCLDDFADEDSLRDRWKMDPIKWWLVHGSATPHLQRDAFETIEDIGILEIANLSLDEPELESVLFDEITEDPRVDNDNLTHFDD